MFDKGSFNEGCNVEKSATNIKHPSHPLIWIIMKLCSRWFSELFRRRKLETENHKNKKPSNHNGQSEESKIPLRANENSK